MSGHLTLMHVPGDTLLVHPVVTSKATEVQVLFPGENERWYEIETFQLFRGRSTVTVPVDMSKVYCRRDEWLC